MPYDAAPLPPVDFKEVLAHLASGVALVSCWDGETPRGLLVSSITGLSVDPPRFLFCVRKEAGCHDALVARPRLGVAVLGSVDEDEALLFASSRRAAERFAPEHWRLDATAPLYRGGLASAACDIDQMVDAATHSIFIVTATDVTFTPGPALVAWNRALSSLG